MPATVTLSSGQVRAYRILASGLARTSASAKDLPVWGLGLQDRDGSARVALGARLSETTALPTFEDPSGSGWTAMAWSLRGAPHLHVRSDLPRLAAAIWPANDADAAVRLAGDAARLRTAGAEPLDSYRAVAGEMRAVITQPMVKGAASAAITAALPAKYSGYCQGCGSTHVRELLFRLAALPAAIGVVPGTKPVVLAPLAPSYPAPGDQVGLGELVTEFYRLYGVGKPADIAIHLGTSATHVTSALPSDLTTVIVDGVRSRAPSGTVDTLRQIDPGTVSDIVRLLPPSDPLLQPRDRSVLVTESAQQKALWPALGPPGAVLAEGGLVGLWRTRMSGKSLTLTITAWRRLSTQERNAIELESPLVGAARGVTVTNVVFD